MEETVYPINFLVKADNWEEVVQVFKDELGIDRGKKNASVREIKGVYIVIVNLSGKQITDEFYKKVCSSQKLAIVNSPLDEPVRNAILNEAYVVETQLRLLLLHVVDIVEGYYAYFAKTYAKDFAKKGEEDVISPIDLNPITSHLSFGDMLNILGLDLSSWDNHALTANNLLELLESGNNIDDIKKCLQDKVKKNIVWDQISKYVLKDNTKWDDIKEDLNRLKQLRDRAAHFQIVTPKDLANAKTLSKTILDKSKERQIISQSDIQKLHDATYIGIAGSLMSAQKAAESIMKTSSQALANAIAPSQLAFVTPAMNNAAAALEAFSANFEATNKVLSTPWGETEG